MTSLRISPTPVYTRLTPLTALSRRPPTSLEDQDLLVGLISSEKDSSSGLPSSVSSSRSLVLTCTWNPLPSPAPLDGESFNECDTLVSRNSPSQGTLLCWWPLPFPGPGGQMDEAARGDGAEGRKMERLTLLLSLLSPRLLLKCC